MDKRLVKVLALSWVSYAIFYFLRVNYSVAIPGIAEEYGLGKTVLGGAASVFFVLYAIGQFVNGQLADNFGPKRLLGLGLFVSILLNFYIPWFGGVIGLLTLIWGLNGFFQAMGWSPSVRIVSGWFGDDYKGRAAGILGTSYIAGGALSWVLAGYVANWGWRYIFFVPSALTLVILVLWIRFGKENPQKRPSGVSFRETISSCVTDERVWLAGMGLFGLNIIRYGFLTWAPTYFFEIQGAGITVATYKALIFPVAGSFGALMVGWLADRMFGGRRTAIGLVMAIGLALSAFAFANVSNWVVGLFLLAVIGFTTYGPHSLLVSQLPMVFGNERNTASICGFIDGIGYIGAAITGAMSGWLVDNFSWNYAFYFWILGALVAGVFIYFSDRRLK